MGTYLVPRLVDAGYEVIHISPAQLMEFRSADQPNAGAGQCQAGVGKRL